MRIPLRLAVVAATIVAGVARIPLANEGVTTTSTALTAGTHDLLAAETAGLVEVRYIPNDARSAQVIVTNKSRKPLSLRLPAAFAGVPVLAQMMGMGMGGRGGAGFGGAGIGGGGQATGGGFGQQGM
ncbi:MAG: hypothetical protein EBZ74_12805, partial [Planctomycetia bacterium]|nr:hypothetical protein [Planctomycetia bacterium]